MAHALISQDRVPTRASGDGAVRVDALIDRALALFERLQDRDDASGDVAFLARVELRPVRERLAVASSEAERREESQRALRRIARSLSAVDVALHGTAESGATIEPMLAQSLATRREYARFRRAVLRVAPPLSTPEEARRALERARVHLAMLVAGDAYPSARPHDRAQIDALVARVAAANGDPAGVALVDVARLWQDVEGLARLTTEVNRRHELVAHDTALIAHACEVLATATDIEPRLRAKLEQLAGLDEDADRLLDDGQWSIDGWRTVLDTLHARLVRPATGRFASLREGAR